MSHIAESYLDNAATTPTRSEVIERMNEVMRDAWGNPSSVHAAGMRAKEVLEESRATIAGALGVEPGEVYFTSGATESNNLAVRGVCSARRDNPAKIITSTLEHASVTRSVRGMRREMNWPVTYIDAIDGKIDLGQLRDALTESPTSLITIMNVQNEVGYIFP
ncbi:MAG: aminotransferase class V-fold PLP-dependent enzyme, partial [Ellagibacter isourolithinifaciens]|nr:aminotransferase class V-fold PLP-dependent enzyme [Ellagibacter isourolithinifaciens]